MLIEPLLLIIVLSHTAVSGDYGADKKKYDACVAQVKKDYPVPNGNVNTQKAMIQHDCGSPPVPPKTPPKTPPKK
jgi:hypothetical protein